MATCFYILLLYILFIYYILIILYLFYLFHLFQKPKTVDISRLFSGTDMEQIVKKERVLKVFGKKKKANIQPEPPKPQKLTKKQLEELETQFFIKIWSIYKAYHIELQ